MTTIFLFNVHTLSYICTHYQKSSPVLENLFGPRRNVTEISGHNQRLQETNMLQHELLCIKLLTRPSTLAISSMLGFPQPGES